MTRGFAGALAVAAGLLAGCGPETAPARPAWLVSISTDAPVPQFGDRLLVEILEEDGRAACKGCRREFGVGEADVWPLSFGIEGEAHRNLRVRARLYRTEVTGAEGPSSDRILDGLVQLPEPEGETKVSIRLSMACFGVLADLEAGTTCDPDSGRSVPIAEVPATGEPELAVASWGPARSVDCAAEAEKGMLCIPGGAFLLGSARHFPSLDLAPVPEQLVQVLPFFLDEEEFTVGDMRALVAEIGEPRRRGVGTDDMCTFLSPDDATNDALPVNCVSIALARAACARKNKRLPSEAEWEWAAGNLGRESEFPWYLGADPCGHATVGVGRPRTTGDENISCVNPGVATGPQPGGHPLDRTELGVHNLGGNVSEWTDDSFQPLTNESCWGSSATLRVDPRCCGPGLPTNRGGNWGGLPVLAHSFDRGASLGPVGSTFVGFRCARPASEDGVNSCTTPPP